VGNGKVIDSGSKSVVAEIDLNDFFDTSDIAIFRPSFGKSEDPDVAIGYIKTRIGCPFNSSFNSRADGSFYCMELIVAALAQTSTAFQLPRKHWFALDLVLPSALEQS